MKGLRAVKSTLGRLPANPMLRVLEQIRRTEIRRRRARAELVDAVALARAEGASWREIGELLGITAQAAHARFRWKVDARR